MWVKQSMWDAINREVASLSAQLMEARHLATTFEDEAKGLRLDLKAERRAKDKVTEGLVDRVLQSRNQRPISDPPKRVSKPEGEPELTAAQLDEREFYIQCALDNGDSREKGIALHDAKRAGAMMPFEVKQAQMPYEDMDQNDGLSH